MKLILTIGLLLAINGCLAIPTNHRWSLIPDSDGKMHLIDLNPMETQLDTEVAEPFFNAETDTRFLLFTRSNPTAAQVLTRVASSVTNSNFNSNWPVRVLIHGFNSGPSSGANIAPTAQYLARGNFNVIVVDWSIGASTINYITARNRVPNVGTVLASFLNFLVSNGFTAWNRVNIAGHSLGAHIAGMAGKGVSGRVQVIFGLDPAGPLFSINAPNARLAANDAVYTEGIRTNAGNLGFDEPLCHADFYPNWGSSQPGCIADIAGSCAHSRAHQFFAESITSSRFVGRRCLNYQQITNRQCTGTGTAIMGGDPGSVGTTGVFFLETNNNSPFARG